MHAPLYHRWPAFAVAAPLAWNSLPDSPHKLSSLINFKKHLKSTCSEIHSCNMTIWCEVLLRQLVLLTALHKLSTLLTYFLTYLLTTNQLVLGYCYQGCGVGLDVSVSRRTNVSVLSRQKMTTSWSCLGLGYFSLVPISDCYWQPNFSQKNKICSKFALCYFWFRSCRQYLSCYFPSSGCAHFAYPGGMTRLSWPVTQCCMCMCVWLSGV